MYSVNAEVFRAQNSPVNFASIPDGLPEPLVFIVSLYYIYIYHLLIDEVKHVGRDIHHLCQRLVDVFPLVFLIITVKFLF